MVGSIWQKQIIMMCFFYLKDWYRDSFQHSIVSGIWVMLSEEQYEELSRLRVEHLPDNPLLVYTRWARTNVINGVT